METDTDRVMERIARRDAMNDRLAWCADNPHLVDALRDELFEPAPTVNTASWDGAAAELRAIDRAINTRIELWLDQDRRISVQELNEWCTRIRTVANRLDGMDQDLADERAACSGAIQGGR